MINEADEAQLVGIRFDNGQMLDGIHFDLGRYARHDSLLQDTRAACAAWGHQFSHGYGLFEAKMPSEKIRWIRSLRGAECELDHERHIRFGEVIHDCLQEPKLYRLMPYCSCRIR